MQVNSVSNITSNLNIGNVTEKSGGAKSFSDLFSEALSNAAQTQQADEQGTLALLTGEDRGIHTTMIESEKAELTLDLAIQIRNKVVDAYNEIMRMQL